MARASRTYRLISADSHVVEPPDLWERWLERKHQDKAPRLVKDSAGADAWEYKKGQMPVPLGLVACVGAPTDSKRYGWRYGEDVHPSCYDGQARLDALDVDGVDAEVLYPPPQAIESFLSYEPEAQLAGLHAYNRWLLEGFCAAGPDRLIGSYAIPNLGVETAVSELKRAVRLGARSVVITMWPSGKTLIGPEDDPFWAEAQSLDVPISIHIKLASQVRPPHPEAARGAMGAAAGIQDMMHLIVDLIFTGTFDRFPSLKIVGAETGCGWIPHFMEMVDDRYWRHRTWTKSPLKKVPSEYFKESWLATFISGHDKSGVMMRHAVGLRNMAWSTDFPHHGNDWPQSRKALDELFVNVPPHEKEMIVCGNAARLYHLVDSV